MAGGGPVGQVASHINSSNPLGPQQGQSTPPTGGAGQMPSFANNPFGPPQQNTGGGMTAQPAVMAEPQVINPSRFTNYGQGNGGGFGGQQFGQQPSNLMTPKQFFDGGFKDPRFNPSQPQQPDNSMMSIIGDAQYRPADMASDMQYRPDGRGGSGMPFGQLLGGFGGGFGGQPQPMQQPGRPAFGQSPEFQGYQTQMRGLQQQMDEYMRKAPMYQQLEDLNNKMQAYQQRHIGQQQQFDPRGGMDYNPQDQQRHQAMYAQRQMMEQALGRPSPFRQNPYQRQLGGGIQGLMGILGGRGGMPQPRMSMGMPQYQRAMTMDMPQARGFSSEFPTNSMKNGGKV